MINLGFEFRSDHDIVGEKLFKAGSLIISCIKRGMSKEETWEELGKAGYTPQQRIITMKVIRDFLRLMKKDPHIYDKSVEKDLGKYK